MITTKTCSSCEHFPNDHHCIGCVWDADKQENTKWELKKNPIVIERAVLDKIRAEIEALPKTYPFVNHYDMYVKEDDVKKIINKYKAESEEVK